MEERRMSHKQVLKLGEALAKEATHHKLLALSTESIDVLTVRALVASYCEVSEALHGDRDSRVAADRVRRHIHEQVEAELQRFYSGQDIRPPEAGEVQVPKVQHALPDTHFSEFLNQALASESFREMAGHVLQPAIDEHLADPTNKEFGPKYRELMTWTKYWIEEGWLDDGMLEDAVGDALIPLVFGKEG